MGAGWLLNGEVIRTVGAGRRRRNKCFYNRINDRDG